MKIYVFAMAMLVATPGLVFSQNPFGDALKLRELDYRIFNDRIAFLEKDTTVLAGIFKKYFPEAASYAELELKMENNPFIRLPPKSIQSSTGGFLLSKSASFLSDFSSMNVTNLADGMARFIVERTKEELNIYFFENFNDAIEKNEDLKHLFPATSDVLLVAGDQLYDYQKFLPVLREAFYQDLRQLLSHSSTWLRSDSKALEKLRADPKLFAIVKFSFDVAAQMSQGEHPGNVLASISDSLYLNDISPNLMAGVKSADLLSRSLRSANPDRFWISKVELKHFEDPHFLQIYLGLLYETIPNELALNDAQITVKNTVAQWADDYYSAKEMVSTISSSLVKIEELVNNLKTDEGPKRYAEISMQTFSFIHTAAKGFGLIEFDPRIKFFSHHTSAILTGIENKQWNTAIFQTYIVLDSILYDHKELTKKFLKYGTFMATVASAENSEEVKAAIEAIALPAGSSRIKRESNINISLNAYIGPYFGTENLSVDGNSNWKNSAGLAVPIGVAFSKGIKPRNVGNGGKSVSLLVSFLDIGALTSFRFQDDNTETVPEIQLKDIISPGAFVIFGFGKAPVSLSAGAQMGPRLQKVTVENADISDTYFRWSVSLLVDIPVLNFYIKPRE